MQILQPSIDGSNYTQGQKIEMWLDIHYRVKCPNCGAIDSMLHGPQGGLAINIKCKSCHIVFWTTPFPVFGAYPIRYDSPTQNQLHAESRFFTEKF